MLSHVGRIRSVRAKLVFRRGFFGDERDLRGLRLACESGELTPVVRGAYMRAAQWEGLRLDERLLARTLAVAHLRGERQPLFSHLSAAVIWGIPVYWTHRALMARVHVTSPPSRRGTSSGTVLQHVADCDDGEEVRIEDLRVTGLARTVLDLARWAPAETAIGCADAGLRRLFGVRRDGELDGVEDWKEQQYGLLGSMRGGRGVGKAQRILRLADPRADSVAESVSRLQLVRLEVPHEIQVRVDGPHGETYWPDFCCLGQRTFGEMDGRAKFTDPEYRRGRSLEQLLLDEREREVVVKGITRYDFVRWDWNAIPTAARLGRRLRGFGLDVPGLG